MAEFEGGVRQAEAEGEERVVAGGVEPAVADVELFRIGGVAIDAGPLLLCGEGLGGGGAGEGEGQLGGGVDVAVEKGGEGVAFFLAGVPGLEDAGNPIDPGHEDCAAGVEEDDGVLIGRGYSGDEGVLVVWEREIVSVVAFRFMGFNEDEGNVGVEREFGGGGEVGAVIGRNFGAGAMADAVEGADDVRRYAFRAVGFDLGRGAAGLADNGDGLGDGERKDFSLVLE